jgi:hypothetical protein
MKARKHDGGKIKMLTAAVRVKKSAVLSPAFAEAWLSSMFSDVMRWVLQIICNIHLEVYVDSIYTISFSESEHMPLNVHIVRGHCKANDGSSSLSSILEAHDPDSSNDEGL